MGIPAIYSAKAVANAILEKSWASSQPMTQMKLHKLLYYSHGWNLALRACPLIDETIEAWKYGPVVRSLYYEFRDCGADPIKRKATDFDFGSRALIEPEVAFGDAEVRKLLDRVWTVYGSLTAAQLSQMTHEVGSPWDKAWSAANGIKGVDIPNPEIEAYFKAKAEHNRALQRV